MEFSVNVVAMKMLPMDAPGHWRKDADDRMNINIADTGNPDFNFLSTIQVMVESYFCTKNKVSKNSVDVWNFTHTTHPDPGILPGCPYKRYRQMANLYVRSLCYDLDYDFDEYLKAIEKVKA